MKTDKGDIICEIVVNCTGMWGYQMGEMLGVNTPIVPFQHQFLVAEPILKNDKIIGVTTSGGYGYMVGKTIAYGYIPFEEAGSDGRNQLEVYGEVFPANREPRRALYDPERKKILT